jgi:methylthioribose-1-phosphate isomerase
MKLELPYLLQSKNICYFEGDIFYIGNRKKFPFERSFICCKNVEQIALAIKNMITQGGGPLQVSLTSLIYIATLMENKVIPYSFEQLQKSQRIITSSRPTNTTMKRVSEGILEKLENEMISLNPTQFKNVVINAVKEKEDEENAIYHNMGLWGASLINDGDTVLTTCFGEHTLILSLYYAKKSGKKISVLANETRPYFQGARLTAPSLTEMEIPVKIISDGMGAYFMRQQAVNHYMTASDLVCMDGTVVNKVGTLPNAIAAEYYGIPYTAFSMSPDKTKEDISFIEMEMRNGQELLNVFNHKISDENIGALYPSFDIINKELVTNIVTNKGIFKPKEIKENF